MYKEVVLNDNYLYYCAHTVTQSLQFMLEVQDDEEWLVQDTAEEEDDNTR